MMTRAKLQRQAMMNKLGPINLNLPGGYSVNALGLQAYLLATHNAMDLPPADVAALATALNDEAFPATLEALCQAAPSNDEDPITGELPEAPIFYKGPHRFSAKGLAEYFKSTGKTTNPFTNVELEPLDITALGAIVEDDGLAASILQKKHEVEQQVAHEGVLDVLTNDFAECVDRSIQMAIGQHGINTGELLDVGTTLFDAGGFARWDPAYERAIQRLNEVVIQHAWDEYVCIEHVRVVIDALSTVFEEMQQNTNRPTRLLRFMQYRHDMIEERGLY